MSVICPSPISCSDLFDPLQPKNYFTGQDFRPGQFLDHPQASSLNMRNLLDMQFSNIPSVGLTEPILGGHLAGYNSEFDLSNTLSPLPIWDQGTPIAQSSGGPSPCMTGIAGPHNPPSKWFKLVAALKLMMASKRLAAKRDRVVELGYPSLAPMTNSQGGWFCGEG